MTESLTAAAKRVADQLMADLKSGKLKKVGIDEVRKYSVGVEAFDKVDSAFAEEKVLRNIIGTVG